MKLKTTLPEGEADWPGGHDAKQLLEQADSPEGAERIYHDQVFPRACMKVREECGETETAELAVIPVGTQPYSPILAAIANRAKRYLLLCTADSRPHAETLVESLDIENYEIFDIGEGTDPVAIFKAVQAELALLGHVAPKLVGFDITSGRKATVATLGSIAAVRGYRQSYIQSDQCRKFPRFHYNEKVVWLPNIRNLMGEDHRSQALALLKACAFEAAAREFEQAAAVSGSARVDVILSHACLGLHRWLAGDWQKSARSFRSALREAEGTPFEEPVAKALKLASDFAKKPTGAAVQKADGNLRAALANGSLPPRGALKGAYGTARRLAELAKEI